ncbi:hypothetical protein [Deinococcus koreensis]|uniref:hypothetical protein n=1 Tax=Deinococcus koreensis TaxID=2054903 RepID=UPI0013FDC3E6|nr:hypothetical protein [Deinococcus koreensis]
MHHTRTWTDIYGSARASFEGRAGGHSWLVAAPPQLAAAVPAALEALDGKGTVELLVHDGLTPLLAAARELAPRGVLVVADRALSGGPAVDVAPQTVTDAGGVEYAEGGAFPAWEGADAATGERGECPAAGAVASLDLPVVVADAGGLRAALEAWLDRTPHGR